jgi:molybdopterin converting factor small subunit
MLRVQLGATLRSAAGGRTEFEVEARNIMELLRALGERYPELDAILARGVAVAIDGQIYRDAWLEPIAPDAEVYLMPRVAGG